MTRTNKWMALAGFIAVCLAVGGLAGWVTSQSVVEWYPTLNKPSWNPPPWIFAPVWTTLYVMMGVAAWLVWMKNIRFSGVRVALILFGVQLALNGLWSFLFFKFHSPAWALVDILALLATLALTVVAFFNQSKLAGLLLVPYLAWVSFATFLNYTIWQLN
jgi:translocator protein